MSSVIEALSWVTTGVLATLLVIALSEHAALRRALDDSTRPDGPPPPELLMGGVIPGWRQTHIWSRPSRRNHCWHLEVINRD